MDILKNFSERQGIGFPLLADPGYEVIDAFGIVNSSVPKDNPFYGFAYAGYYILGPDGLVKSKYFNEENNNRTTAASILMREFEASGDSPQGEAETAHLRIRWSVSNPIFRPGQRGALLLEVEPKQGMHVYAPEVEGYIPVSWKMKPAEDQAEFADDIYPEAKIKHLPAIDESVPIYEGPFRVMRDIRVLGSREFTEALAGRSQLVVEGEFHYQACDATKCYFPTSIPLKWTLDLSEHDLVRVPEEIQRN